MTELQAQNRLYEWLSLRGYGKHTKPLIPNFTPPDWWEADLYALTEASLAWEFEIKLTARDFRQDAAKKRRGWCARVGIEQQTKYQQLEARDARGPSRFSYAMPLGMVPESEVPSWAGLVVFDPARKNRAREIRKPPLLHSNKVPEAERQRIMRNFYYRFWSCRMALERAGGSEAMEKQQHELH